MSMLTIDRLNVAGAYVTDLAVAIRFYEEVLGFEKERDMEPGILLYSKGADLNLYLEGGRQPRESSARIYPSTFLCFRVKEGVRAALEKIKDSGSTVVSQYGDFESGFSGFQFTDPSGNVIEIAGKP